MNTQMNDDNCKTIEQLTLFIAGTQEIDFKPDSQQAGYEFITLILKRFGYRLLGRSAKGIVMAYLRKVTGYSRQQLTRLISHYVTHGSCTKPRIKRHRFSHVYTVADIILLAQVDQWDGRLNGVATKKLCERAYLVYGQAEYERLATISVSHLYNLRQSDKYRQKATIYTKTQPVCVPIGTRKKPRPNGQPGYLRVDTVHQGDQDKVKGLYHINAVDEVTQFEIIISVEKISEAYLEHKLISLLEQFPFVIKGFHTDNGSEYINKYVAKILNKLLIEQTKSRSRHSNDNALGESKNGSIVRKQYGYAHLPQYLASEANVLNKDYLNPYLNFHRPCLFPTVKTNAKGKERKYYKYEDSMTPYDKLKSLEQAQQYLKTGITFDQLDKEAKKLTDNEAAKLLQEAKARFFNKHFDQVLLTKRYHLSA